MSTSLLTCSALLLLTLTIWTNLLNREVSQPYLDEFFHIPQAQQYCQGHLATWDDKITTPPGLYLLAASLSPLLGCSVAVLRIENAGCCLLLFLVIYLIQGQSSGISRISDSAAHTALNAALFPPLYFFSALYYTDTLSTMSVLAYYALWRSRKLNDKSEAVEGLCLYMMGVVTLFFRQTNIFWVAIFPAVLTAIQVLDRGHDVVKTSMRERRAGFGDSMLSIVKTSWKMSVVYDQDIDSASIDDYARCIASLSVAAVKALTDLSLLSNLLLQLSPYLGLLVTFAGFVLINGSVVLGDKSNHVATLHASQMLYIWPYITFFSWPVLLPRFCDLIYTYLDIVRLTGHLPQALQRRSRTRPPHIRYLLLSTAVAGLTVHYNTIIHPFTLADNRHYTFYVFRLLMRPWWMRYAVVPVYSITAWLCIQSLGNCSDQKQIKSASGARSTRRETSEMVFVLAWLITSTLQLITAPLVEPRYFMLPWIFWRLGAARSLPKQSSRTAAHGIVSEDVKHYLWLETIWHLIVNVVTGYIFLKWTFVWPSEPYNVQRFMW